MEKKIKNIMSEIFEIKEDEVIDDLKPDDVSLWDSLNHLKMITALEEVFDVKLTMNEINSMDSYAKIKTIIKKHI
jgi:acyl carrier protein